MKVNSIKRLMLTVFSVILICCCLSVSSQAVMSGEDVRSRLSDYSGSYVKTEDNTCYYEYKKWDVSEDEIYDVIHTMAESLMADSVKDYCRVSIKFFFTHKNYGSDFEGFFDKLTLVKKKLGNFYTEWSRYNKMTMSVTSYKSGEYFSANFVLSFNGSEQDKDIFNRPVGKDYDEKLLSLVKQAQENYSTVMDRVQFFLRWLDENASYVILTGYSNDPRYALIEGKTVCGGYANAFKDLCNAAGIPAIVPVNMQANHAWSQVYVDGVWYTADLCNVVRSKSGTYNGYLFTDPDLSTDCNDFVEKYKSRYVESFKNKNTVNLSKCTFEYNNSWTYTGKSITPPLTVKYGKKTLQAGVHYNLAVSNNKNPGQGKISVVGIKKNGYSGSKSLTFDITLPKAEVTASSGKNYIKLSWKAVSGATGYTVKMYNSKTGKYESLKSVKGTSCTVEKLSPGKKYQFTVRTDVKINGKTYKGSEEKITVYTAPDKVKNFRASSVGDTYIKLRWSGASGADKYEIQMSTDGKKWKNTATTKKKYYTVKKLTADKKYYFRIRAVNGNGKGSYSSKIAVTTLISAPSVSVTAGKGSFTVKWSKVPTAKGYMIHYATNVDMMNGKKITVKKGSSVKKTVSGLKSKKNYYVRVRAYKTVNGEKVYGAYSSVKKVKTK
ncbi:MAG: fibronectin type III domain-containing protein [Clostridia bacterium]|nr:fibronectin type III domain-containing protein [Clostridia bacterium]